MEQVLLIDAGAKLHYWNTDTGEVRQVGQVPGGRAYSDMTVTPEGEIYAVAGTELYQIDRVNLSLTALTSLGSATTAGLGHTPDGLLLVGYRDAGRIDIVNPATLETTGSIDMGDSRTSGDVVADDDFIYVATIGQTIEVYDRATGLLQSSKPHGLGGIVFALALDEDGVIAFAGQSAYRVASDGTQNTTLLQNLALGTETYGASTLPDLTIEGTEDLDELTGTPWNDTLIGLGDDDFIDGGAGEDLAVYAGDRDQYSIRILGDAIRIEDRSGAAGNDQVSNVEALQFDDQTWDLDRFVDLAGLSPADLTQFVEMYIAYFNRAPDAEGLFFWGSALNNGTSLEEIAALFFDQTETRLLYPEGTTTGEFVMSVYGNVLGRAIDQAGFDFWVQVLDAGDVDRPTFMLEILQGAKAPAPDGASQEFIDQKAADVAYLSDKTDLGTYFSVILGMSDVTDARGTMALFDGTPASLTAAKDAIDAAYADALDADDGEFLLSLVGVVDDPFMM